MVIDGNNSLIRAHFAMGRRDETGSFVTLKTSDGRESGAIYGAILQFTSLVGLIKPDYVLWTFDGGRSKARLAIRPEYKANRDPDKPDAPKTPSSSYSAKNTDFHTSFDGFKEFLNIVGVRYIQEYGVEADDLISSATQFAPEVGVVIVSQDHDLLQLVNNDVVVYKTSNAKNTPDMVYSISDVVNKYGVLPEQLAKLWALTGDIGDNVVGIKGVGEKTALKMLNEYNFNLEDVAYNHPKVLAANATQVVLENYDLIKLNRTTAKFDVTLNECEFNPNTNSDLLMDWLVDWEMNSLVVKLTQGTLWS